MPTDYSLPAITTGVAQLVEGLIGKVDHGLTQLPVLCFKVPLVVEASPANGGLFSWQNPYNSKGIAIVLLNVRTPATGAATADIGAGSAAATSNDGSMDAVDVGAAALLANGIDDGGTNGLLAEEIDENGGTNDWITGTASADSSGIVGEALIIFIPTVV